jgi:hypothetical protein
LQAAAVEADGLPVAAAQADLEQELIPRPAFHTT